MSRIKMHRTPTERRRRLAERLRRIIARRRGFQPSEISDSDPIGPDFRDILNEVVTAEGQQTLKHFGPTNEETTFQQAVEFLMTVVQS